MSNEIRGVSTSGTLYARIMNSSGQIWNGTTFEAYTAANYANYDIAMTEQGNSAVYVANFPTTITTGGTYEYYVHRQSGASPAEGDPITGTGNIDWSGTISITASSAAMTGSDFYSYLLRRGFKRTDKSAEAFEAITDAIQEMRRRFMFDEAETEMTTTDTISVAGDYKLTLETNFGLLLDLILQDGTTAMPLNKVSKKHFDDLYQDHAVTADRGYPKDYCIYAGQLYIGPIPDSTAYTYRIGYSTRAGTVTSSTVGVPFTDVYRDVLCDLTMSILYEGLEEYDKANYYRNKFEVGFITATRRERVNTGEANFNMTPIDV